MTAPTGYSSETSTSFKIAKGTEAQRINVKILPAYTCKIKVGKVEVYVKADGKWYLAYSGKIKITKTGTKTITLPAKSKWTVSKPIRN